MQQNNHISSAKILSPDEIYYLTGYILLKLFLCIQWNHFHIQNLWLLNLIFI